MCGFEGICLKREEKKQARVAQLVEYDLAKVGVAGSSPVSRSFICSGSLDYIRISAVFVFKNKPFGGRPGRGRIDL